MYTYTLFNPVENKTVEINFDPIDILDGEHMLWLTQEGMENYLLVETKTKQEIIGYEPRTKSKLAKRSATRKRN
jgi:hypothetical protein